MQATLIYNPNSGITGKLPPERLLEALLKAGYDPVHPSTASEDDLAQVLRNAKGLVVVAGGDGSFRAVATRLINNNEVFLTPLPLGTANNICRNLGMDGGPLEIIERLANPKKLHFDVGYVRAPWGEDYFLEAMGYGLYADGLARYDPNEGRSLLRSLSTLAETLSHVQPYPVTMLLDGQDVSGDYIMVEVMNTQSFGPRVKIAPQADPGDGMLDVVRVKLDERDNLFRYIGGLLREELDELPSVEIGRGRRLEMVYHCDFPLHVDAEVRPPMYQPRESDQSPAVGAHTHEPGEEHRLLVEVLPHALELWLPEEPEEGNGRLDE